MFSVLSAPFLPPRGGIIYISANHMIATTQQVLKHDGTNLRLIRLCNEGPNTIETVILMEYYEFPMETMCFCYNHDSRWLN